MTSHEKWTLLTEEGSDARIPFSQHLKVGESDPPRTHLRIY